VPNAALGDGERVGANRRAVATLIATGALCNQTEAVHRTCRATPSVADVLIEINDEQRRGWFLSYSVRLWRGRIGTVALPLVDFLQRSSHERCPVGPETFYHPSERL
jgi:hypothetical protein